MIGYEKVKAWNYAVANGDQISDSWAMNDFENEQYHLQTYGPNGFFREFKGNASDPNISVTCEYERTKKNTKKLTGNIKLIIKNTGNQSLTVEITDNAYKSGSHKKVLAAMSSASIVLDLSKSFAWYDFSVKVKSNKVFEKRYAGHVETGMPSISDPVMGHTVL